MACGHADGSSYIASLFTVMASTMA